MKKTPKITKAHLICHFLTTFGPMTRAELLKLTAEKEGKPYKPRSNNSYFVPHRSFDPAFLKEADVERRRRSSLVANGTIKAVGKKGRALLYTLDTKGVERAAEFLDLT
jgi:hypothetical protein